VEALLHSTDKTTHFLTGRIDDLPCGILHEFGDNTVINLIYCGA
jgi:hypothetical protein